MSQKFIKRNESFVCQNCGFFNTEDKNGSCRNHCAECLYSMHLDIYPGDRKSYCKSLMKPMYMEMKGDNIVIYHKCISCKILKKNKASREDNLSILYEEKK